MAVALRRLRDRVRGRLRDTDDRKATYTSVEVDQAICDAYLALAARLPAPSLYTASALTISAGADTFTLPTTVTGYTGNDGGAEYAGDVRLQLVSTGEYLARITVDEIDAYRHGSIAPLPQGIPRIFALWEEADQDIQGRCWPPARIAEPINMWRTMMVDDLRDYVGAGTDDMDDVEVLFSRLGASALVLYTAADLLARMTPEDLALRRLNPKVATSWRRDAETSLYLESSRRHDIEEIGRRQRLTG